MMRVSKFHQLVTQWTLNKHSQKHTISIQLSALAVYVSQVKEGEWAGSSWSLKWGMRTNHNRQIPESAGRNCAPRKRTSSKPQAHAQSSRIFKKEEFSPVWLSGFPKSVFNSVNKYRWPKMVTPCTSAGAITRGQLQCCDAKRSFLHANSNIFFIAFLTARRCAFTSDSPNPYMCLFVHGHGRSPPKRYMLKLNLSFSTNLGRDRGPTLIASTPPLIHPSWYCHFLLRTCALPFKIALSSTIS